MKRKIVGLTLLGIGMALAAGLYIAGIARPVSAAAPQEESAYGPGVWHGQGVLDEDLAKALGITTDQLNSAYQETYNTALDQAVAQGLITQAQAEQLNERGHAFPFGGRWGAWLEQNGIDFQALLAGALDITPEALNAAYAQAFNAQISRAVESGRLTEEQADLARGRYALQNSEAFRSSLQSAYEQAVQQAVEDGIITQSQADQILKSHKGGWLGGPGMGHPGGFIPDEFGGFGRHGRGGQFFREFPDEITPLPQPTTSPNSGA